MPSSDPKWTLTSDRPSNRSYTTHARKPSSLRLPVRPTCVGKIPASTKGGGLGGAALTAMSEKVRGRTSRGAGSQMAANLGALGSPYIASEASHSSARAESRCSSWPNVRSISR
ncbi:MAG: hypothetical protein IPM79_08175 [Polyangiaceae bacterium]|nr:hypothetical protein [Polyangiaceae bacterium]